MHYARMKKLLIGSAIVVTALLVVMLARTNFASSAPNTRARGEHSPWGNGRHTLSAAELADELAQAIRFPTIANGDSSPKDPDAFRQFHQWLEQTYPDFFAATELTVINEFSLLFRWEGLNESAEPIALLSHQDVVPIEAATRDEWQHPPFGGVIKDGFVWGRGALDDKGGLIMLVAAADSLAAEGFSPKRDVYFAFGHDEEVGGELGAVAIAQHLADQGIELAWLLDEGSAVVGKDLMGLPRDMAMINGAEKGYLTVTLTARAGGGHSSTPGPETAITILADAITRLNAHQMPARLDGNTRELVLSTIPLRPIMTRVILSNLWLTESMVVDQLLSQPATAAQLRTTTAVTVIAGGEKDNILPQQATATVNFRIHPRDTIQSVLDHVNVVVDDERVLVEWSNGNEPPPASGSDGVGYAVLAAAAAATFPDVVVAPGMTLGATDSRHFTGVSRETYRFMPIRANKALYQTVHGTNERVTISDLPYAVEFYRRVLLSSG